MARRQTRKPNMDTEETKSVSAESHNVRQSSKGINSSFENSSGRVQRRTEYDRSDERSPLKGGDGVHKVWTTPCSRLQAPLQSRLRPAVWVPGLRRLHSHTETWTSTHNSGEGNLQSVLKAVFRVIETDSSRSDFNITKVEEGFLQIHVFTRAEWLDVIEMRFHDNTVKISAFSSGFLPLFLPGACFFNLLFFWVPFLDMGMNARRLKWIRARMGVQMEVSVP